MAGTVSTQRWDPVVRPPADPPGPPRIDERALAEPSGWARPRVVELGPGVDLFAGDVERALIERVVAAVAATPQHAYLLRTTRAKRLLALGNDGLALPRNLWPGVVVESDDQVWRAEDLLRCNTARAWVAADPLRGPLPSLPVGMLAWLVVAVPDGPEVDAGPELEWVRDLRDRCVDAGVPFRFEARRADGSVAARSLDGRVWAEIPAALADRADRPG